MAIFTFGNTTKTVDSVLSAFKNTIADLNAVAEEQKAIAAAQEEAAAQALTNKAIAEAEATRATAIAAQMSAVFN